MELLALDIGREASRRRMVRMLDKVSSCEHLQNGDWGNATPLWRKWRDIPLDYPDPIHPRYLEQGHPPNPAVHVSQIATVMKDLMNAGVRESALFFHAWPPEGSMILNCRSRIHPITGDHWLAWTTNSNPNIDSHECGGMLALGMIRHFAGPYGYEHWRELSDIGGTQDLTIEFTIHDRCVGRLGLSVAVWDIRRS